MNAIHVEPRPQTVAEIWDSYGSHVAHERWGHLDPGTVDRIARAGRLAAGRTYPGQGLRTSRAGGEDLLDRGWDGAPPAGAVEAAAALGIPISHLQEP